MHEYISGTLFLDFLDTVGGRLGEPVERLGADSDLDEWSRGAGWDLSAEPTAADLGAALRLRTTLERLVENAIAGERPAASGVEELNGFARLPKAWWQLDGASGRKVLAGVTPPALLAAIAADAIDVLGSPAVQRIRQCGGCGMFFLDRSRPGRRRWCASASGCGGRDRVKRHRERVPTAKNRRTGKGDH